MWTRAVLIGVLTAIAVPSVAAADPPGPTDYLTEIVAVEPATDAVTLTVAGGDAFIVARVERGHELVVLGYQGEPYLRFDPDGAVFENAKSEATYYNEERYGGEVPDFADSDAEPEWRRVADDGEFAWHDHRAHWMSEEPLVGLEPGDALPRQQLDLIVDDLPTTVTVETVLQPEPSRLPVLLGGLVGIAAAAALWWRSKWVPLLVGGTAVAVGVAQYLSVPGSTGPPWWWVALPVGAFGAGVFGAALAPGHYARPVAVLGTGAFLAVWSWLRLGHVTAAYVPSEFPMALDRSLAAAFPIAAVALVVTGAASTWGQGVTVRRP